MVLGCYSEASRPTRTHPRPWTNGSPRPRKPTRVGSTQSDVIQSSAITHPGSLLAAAVLGVLSCGFLDCVDRFREHLSQFKICKFRLGEGRERWYTVGFAYSAISAIMVGWMASLLVVSAYQAPSLFQIGFVVRFGLLGVLWITQIGLSSTAVLCSNASTLTRAAHFLVNLAPIAGVLHIQWPILGISLIG